jgi:hypothetical protein
MAQDAFAGANFVGRLLDPYDANFAPQGHAAWDNVIGAGKGALSYIRARASDPAKIAGDLDHIGVGANVYLPARPAPLAPTVLGELGNQFRNGLDAGEGVFNARALIGGLAELRSIPELRELSKGAAAADYMPAAAPQRLADYMATEYFGMGSHDPLGRSAKLPWGSPVPKVVLESPFNRKMPPEGTPRGAFYRYHYAVDPDYHGGPVKRAFGGGGWSGKDLGWTKYGPAARSWYGTPWQTKAAGYGALAGLGWPVAQFSRGDGQR